MATPTPEQIMGSSGGTYRGTPTPEQIMGAGSTSKKKEAKKKKSSGLLGHLGEIGGNLISDAEASIAGIPSTVGALAKAEAHDLRHGVIPFLPGQDPRKSELVRELVLPTLKSWGYQYGPAVHGDFGETAHRVEEHPLGPVLDLLTLLSAGAGRVAAVALTPAEESRLAAGVTGKYGGPAREIAVRGSEGGAETTVRTLPRQGYRAGRMLATDKALKSLPADLPVVGEFARAARAIQKEALPVELRHLADDRYTEYLKAQHALNRDERAAAALIPRLPLSHDLDAYIEQLSEHVEGLTKREQKIRAATVSVLTRPGVREAYELTGKNADKMRRAVEAGRKLADAREEILARTTKVSPETLAESPYRHMQTIRSGGVRPWTKEEAEKALATLERQHNAAVDRYAKARFGPIDQAEVNARTRNNRRAMRQASGRGGSSSWKSQLKPNIKDERFKLAEQEIIDEIERNPAQLRQWADRIDEINKLHSMLNPDLFDEVDLTRLGMLPDPRGRVLGGSAADLRAEVEAAGRPLPYYTPDRTAARKATAAPRGRGGGLTPPSMAADLRQSENTLFRMGMLALNPDLLGPAFLRAVQHDYRLDLFNRARDLATPIERGEGLPQGYRWLREIRGERIPSTETQAGEHLGGGARAFPEEYERLTMKDKKTADELIAKDKEGRRLIVPDRFAQGLELEGRRASLVNKLMVSKPLQVWRALVLHTNPSWLTNNVVGNGLLWTLRFAGVPGLKAFAGMIGETKGVRAVRELLNAPETRNHLTIEDITEMAPSQRHGTMVETQFPHRQPLRGRLERLEKPRNLAASPFRLLPTVDRATEGAYRRAGLETVLRKSPEAKAFYKSMSKETKSWRAAMKGAWEKDPSLQRMAEREVNDALGSYLSLTPSERGVLRQTVPFYAWFREITRITMKLPFDAPGRTLIASRLSQVQDERARDLLGDLPSYLRGAIPLGPPRNGEQESLMLQGANPFGTVPQLGRAISHGLFGGGSTFQPGLYEAAGMVNPLLGTAIRSRDEGLVSGLKTGVVQQLPAYRAFLGPTDSALYPNRTRIDTILRYLGDPVRRYDPSVAAKYAKEG